MAFHLEIRRGLHHAQAFSLEEPEVRRAVLEPWLRGVAVMLALDELACVPQYVVDGCAPGRCRAEAAAR